MDQSLIPFVFAAPPGQAVLYHAPVPPAQADLEVSLFTPYNPVLSLTKQTRIHWAQKLFDEQPRSSTSLRHRRE